MLYSRSNLKEVLQAENFSVLSYDYYEGEDLQNFKKAVENSLSFIRNFDTEYQNLLFFGAVGTGKTFLSNCIAYELLQHGYSVIYFPLPVCSTCFPGRHLLPMRKKYFTRPRKTCTIVTW